MNKQFLLLTEKVKDFDRMRKENKIVNYLSKHNYIFNVTFDNLEKARGLNHNIIIVTDCIILPDELAYISKNVITYKEFYEEIKYYNICRKCKKVYDKSLEFIEDVEMLEALNYFNIGIEKYCPNCLDKIEENISKFIKENYK